MVIDDAGCARSVTGKTRNLSGGGCRLHLERPCPSGDPPMISLELEDGNLMAEAFVIDSSRDSTDGCWDYRVAFTAIDPIDRDRLLRLTAA